MEGADGVTGPVVTVRDVRLRRGERVILDGMSFEVARGEVVALMGLSGSGKTTILRAIAALEMFESGSIDVDRVVLPSGSQPVAIVRELRHKVGMGVPVPLPLRSPDGTAERDPGAGARARRGAR
jgi:ABC-type transporter Mla maintaining outer membrane lipid asymmetry ATPase subunit MlaF